MFYVLYYSFMFFSLLWKTTGILSIFLRKIRRINNYPSSFFFGIKYWIEGKVKVIAADFYIQGGIWRRKNNEKKMKIL